MKYEYQLTLRLPEPIAEALKQRAKSAKRSMNSEIINILTQTIETDLEEDTRLKLQRIISNAESILHNLK